MLVSAVFMQMQTSSRQPSNLHCKLLFPTVCSVAKRLAFLVHKTLPGLHHYVFYYLCLQEILNLQCEKGALCHNVQQYRALKAKITQGTIKFCMVTSKLSHMPASSLGHSSFVFLFLPDYEFCTVFFFFINTHTQDFHREIVLNLHYSLVGGVEAQEISGLQ